MSRNYHRRNARSDAVIESLEEQREFNSNQEAHGSGEKTSEDPTPGLGKKDDGDTKSEKMTQ